MHRDAAKEATNEPDWKEAATEAALAAVQDILGTPGPKEVTAAVRAQLEQGKCGAQPGFVPRSPLYRESQAREFACRIAACTQTGACLQWHGHPVLQVVADVMKGHLVSLLLMQSFYPSFESCGLVACLFYHHILRVMGLHAANTVPMNFPVNGVSRYEKGRHISTPPHRRWHP